jgi:hypothetical protein
VEVVEQVQQEEQEQDQQLVLEEQVLQTVFQVHQLLTQVVEVVQLI